MPYNYSRKRSSVGNYGSKPRKKKKGLLAAYKEGGKRMGR